MTAYTRQLLFIRRLQEREYEKLKKAHPKDYAIHSTSKLNGLLAVEQTLIKLVDLEEASMEMNGLFHNEIAVSRNTEKKSSVNS